MNSNRVSSDYPNIDPNKLPFHVAIIMDGNGRWAKKRLLNRIKGHEKGANTVRTIVETCREIGIRILTLYAFSTENWQRPKKEIFVLFSLLKKFLDSECQTMMDNDIQLQAIGQIERLPKEVLDTLSRIMSLTQNNKAMTLNLALSYGGRAEIIKMVQEIALDAKAEKIDPNKITAELIENHLYTKGMQDPDLLIRTSGEMRISNFLLWQIAYSEIYVTNTLWPDFSKEEFVHIIEDYQKRDRRFGGIRE